MPLAHRRSPNVKQEGTKLPTLTAEGWAVLGVLHRIKHGGPVAPIAESSIPIYKALTRIGLVIETSPGIYEITDEGEAALGQYHLR